MSAYRLTDAAASALAGELEPISGYEEDKARNATNTRNPNLRGFRVADGYIWVPELLLEPAVPPVPAEPEPGPWLIGDVPVMRWPGDTTPDRWQVPDQDSIDGFVFRTWESAWTQLGAPYGVTIRRLVPEPEPVRPTDHVVDHDGDQISILHLAGVGSCGCQAAVHINGNSAHLTGAQALGIAAELTRIAGGAR